jgi:hypothetical protein
MNFEGGHRCTSSRLQRPAPLSVREVFAILFISLTFCVKANGQCEGDLSWDFDELEQQGFSVGRFFADAVTPQLISDTKRIRTYVRDERFRMLLQRCGDLRTVDGIYLKSLRIADHNIARALFLSMMGVLEHRNIDFRVPIVKSLSVPLTFEEDSLFRARYFNLPSRLYPDTPPEGDRDKLQHFFASAYLSFATESSELSRTAGNLVEWGEAQFIVGGADDPRDKRANKQGERFGRDLLVVKTLLPSDYLTLPYNDAE